MCFLFFLNQNQHLVSFKETVLEPASFPRRTHEVVSMPEVEEMINLAYLTDAERELIVEVLHRDAELRKNEEQRIRWGEPKII